MNNTTTAAQPLDLDSLRFDHRGALMVPDPTGDYILVPDVRALIAQARAAQPAGAADTTASASIGNDPEFSELLSVVIGMNETGGAYYLRARAELVDFIDSRTQVGRASLAPVSAQPVGYVREDNKNGVWVELEESAIDKLPEGAPVYAAPVSAQQGAADVSSTLFVLKRDSFVSETAFDIYQAEMEGWRTKLGAAKAPAAQAVAAEQDRRALELANAALIAAQPRDTRPEGWKRHEEAINATNCALHKPATSPASTPEAAPEQQVAQIDLENGHWMDIVAAEIPRWNANKFKTRVLYTANPTAGAATTSEDVPSEKQAKLRALADRIDFEELWRGPAMDRHMLSDEQRDRLDAGVMLRRYSDLLAPGRWLVVPPTGSVQFSAGSLEKVTEMAKADQDRKAMRATQQEGE